MGNYMRDNKTPSPTLIIILLGFLGLLTLFIMLIYFKINPREIEKPIIIIDQSLIIKSRDSAIIIYKKDISILKKDTTSLRKSLDFKNDTITFMKNKIYYLSNKLVKPVVIVDTLNHK
jgi:hypothetical protein